MAQTIGASIRDKGFLLRSVDYGDNHRILSFLTAAHGRIGVIAWAAQTSRKRFSGLLDFLHCLQVEFRPNPRGGLAELLQCSLEGDFPWVQNDYGANIAALEWIRLLGQALREGQHVAGLFELLEEALIELKNGDFRRTDLSFRRNLLSRLGFHLELGRCAACETRIPGQYRFFPESGGLVCGSCAREQTGEFFLGPWDWNSAAAEERPEQYILIRRFLDRSFEHFLGFPVDAKKYG
jgi:DNA repair protein RecO (recombination protein O)